MNNYRKTNITVSMINYHFIFCPRYRRKIFDDHALEQRFKEMVIAICQEVDIEVIAHECDRDHTHLFISAPPSLSPARIMAKIKGITSKQLREEFPHLQHLKTLWTRSYFVSTAGSISSETIKIYVENQKKTDVKSVKTKK